MKSIVLRGKFSNVLVSVIRLILCICNILATFLVVTNVFLRYVLKIDFLGYEEIITAVVMWMYFIGASYGSYEKSHISADMLSEKLKGDNAKRMHAVIISALDTAIIAIFLYWSIKYGIWNLKNPMFSASLRMPLMVSQSAIIVGFSLMFAFNIYYLIYEIKDVVLLNNITEENK